MKWVKKEEEKIREKTLEKEKKENFKKWIITIIILRMVWD
jgi:hypothetical protein